MGKRVCDVLGVLNFLPRFHFGVSRIALKTGGFSGCASSSPRAPSSSENLSSTASSARGPSGIPPKQSFPQPSLFGTARPAGALTTQPTAQNPKVLSPLDYTVGAGKDLNLGSSLQLYEITTIHFADQWNSLYEIGVFVHSKALNITIYPRKGKTYRDVRLDVPMWWSWAMHASTLCSAAVASRILEYVERAAMGGTAESWAREMQKVHERLGTVMGETQPPPPCQWVPAWVSTADAAPLCRFVSIFGSRYVRPMGGGAKGVVPTATWTAGLEELLQDQQSRPVFVVLPHQKTPPPEQLPANAIVKHYDDLSPELQFDFRVRFGSQDPILAEQLEEKISAGGRMEVYSEHFKIIGQIPCWPDEKGRAYGGMGGTEKAQKKAAEALAREFIEFAKLPLGFRLVQDEGKGGGEVDSSAPSLLEDLRLLLFRTVRSHNWAEVVWLRNRFWFVWASWAQVLRESLERFVPAKIGLPEDMNFGALDGALVSARMKWRLRVAESESQHDLEFNDDTRVTRALVTMWRIHDAPVALLRGSKITFLPRYDAGDVLNIVRVLRAAHGVVTGTKETEPRQLQKRPAEVTSVGKEKGL